MLGNKEECKGNEGDEAQDDTFKDKDNIAVDWTL